MDLFGNLKRMPLSPHLSAMFPACSATAYQHPWQVVTTWPLPYITKASSCCRQHVVPSGGFFTYTWDAGTTEIHGNATRRDTSKTSTGPTSQAALASLLANTAASDLRPSDGKPDHAAPCNCGQPKCDACCQKKTLKTRTPSTKINGRKKHIYIYIYRHIYNHSQPIQLYLPWQQKKKHLTKNIHFPLHIPPPQEAPLERIEPLHNFDAYGTWGWERQDIVGFCNSFFLFTFTCHNMCVCQNVSGETHLKKNYLTPKTLRHPLHVQQELAWVRHTLPGLGLLGLVSHGWLMELGRQLAILSSWPQRKDPTQPIRCVIFFTRPKTRLKLRGFQIQCSPETWADSIFSCNGDRAYPAILADEKPTMNQANSQPIRPLQLGMLLQQQNHLVELHHS